MADVIFTKQELTGLSTEDMVLLREHVLNHIQTSAEVRQLIAQRRKEFVEMHPRMRATLRRKADALRERLKQQSRSASGGGGRKKRGGRKKSPAH
jgi:hypothetical protein